MACLPKTLAYPALDGVVLEEERTETIQQSVAF